MDSNMTFRTNSDVNQQVNEDELADMFIAIADRSAKESGLLDWITLHL